jgi:hypothetical protein
VAPYTDTHTNTEDRAAPGDTIETPHGGLHGRTLFQQYTAVGRFLVRETIRRWRQRRRTLPAPSEPTVPTPEALS